MDLENIAHEPGCYLFKDGGGRIIYVGKAKDIAKRVSSYFQKKDLDPKTQALVDNISSLDFIITQNEIEALILESNLIKKHQPKYNIDLKDSKRYAYILLTQEEFPRLLIARSKTTQGVYFGPFISAEKRDVLLRFANNIFKLRTCKRLPKKPCLRFHMDLCSAPCIQRSTKEAYNLAVRDAESLLSGKNKQLLKELRERMIQKADNREYEHAKVLRDQITAIESLDVKQNMETRRAYDQDVLGYIVDNSIVHLAVFNVYSGVLSNKDEFDFVYVEDFFEEFILQYYSKEAVPREVILPEEISLVLKTYLSKKRGSKVKVTVPVKGEKKDLLDLVEKNVEKSFMEDELRLRDLKEKLGLQKIPKTIECFDISHTSGSNPVGSMVRFVDGKPDKSGYRRFKIKTVEGIDDCAMIAEVVGRRYKRLKKEEKKFPDLVVIDGGVGQLSSAFRELHSLEVKIPVVALAKKNEEIYFPGFSDPVCFERKSRAVKLLQNIRDEAHRFAVSYHRLLRKKRILNKK